MTAKDKDGNLIDPEGRNYGNVSSADFFGKYGGDYDALAREQNPGEYWQKKLDNALADLKRYNERMEAKRQKREERRKRKEEKDKN